MKQACTKVGPALVVWLATVMALGSGRAASAASGAQDDPDDDRFEMFYTAVSDTKRIGRATSEDGFAWVNDPDPVLVPGEEGEWDAEAVTDPSVIIVDGVHYMYYAGENEDGKEQLGLATSTDGRSWAKHPANPLIEVGPPGSHDAVEVSNPMVVKVGETYRLYYAAVPDTAVPETTGLATSPDGVHWTKFGDGPVIDVGAPGTYNENESSDPGIIRLGRHSYLDLFTAVDGTSSFDPQGRRTIGRAESRDGLTWRISRRPVFAPNPDTSAFDSLRVGNAEVERIDGQFVMYYGGKSDDEDLPEGTILPDGSATTQSDIGAIGIATSRSGTTWRRLGPSVLQPRADWEGTIVANPSVVIIDD